MRKYWLIAKYTWDETLTYRLNFVMWRIRVVFQLLVVYFLWLSILPADLQIHGYTQSAILTYILGTSLVNSFVASSRSFDIGDDINTGRLSNFLTKPMDYFKYWFFRDLGDKAMNLVFSVGEITILLLLLRPPILIQTDFSYLILSFISVALAIIMYFLFNILLGTLAFWSPEVWAPRFIFTILLNFFSGGLFPLDILPESVFSVLQVLPFSYLLFFPLKIYLGQIVISQIYFGFLICCTWIFILFILAKFTWSRGLFSYTAYGR